MDLLKHYIEIGSLVNVKTIISKADFKFGTERTDYILLKTSLRYRNKEITKFLIENNFRLNKISLREQDTTPLHLAVNLDWKDIVQLLLQKGASVAVRESGSGMTPIQLSFFMKNYKLTDLMLPYDKGEGLLDTEVGILHFHIAAARNCVNIVNKYLRMGEYFNSSVPEDYSMWPQYTALHFAVEFDSRETVELLLEWGADINAQDKMRNTPLHLAARRQNESLIELLLSKLKYSNKNPKNYDNFSHFHIACMKNDVKNVCGFLQYGVALDVKVNESAEMFPGFTALHFAVINQCTDVVRLLLANKTFAGFRSESFLLEIYKTKESEFCNSVFSENNIRLFNAFQNENISPLLKACVRKRKEKIEQLIHSGVMSVNDRMPADASRWPSATALHIIVEYTKDNENENIIKLLLSKVKTGAVIAAVDTRGKTPLHIAFEKRNYALVKSLLDQYSRVKVNFVADKDGLSHFHIACTVPNLSIVDKFLAAGADVNVAVNTDSVKFPGYTPLHFAVTYRLPGVADKLLSRNADITMRNGLGLTALDLLLETWDSEGQFSNACHQLIASIVKSAHERGIANSAAFDSRGFTPMHVAVMTANQEMLESCIDRRQVNTPVDFQSALYPGYTALHLAVLLGTDEMLRTLLDHGGDPSALTGDGSTPLHLALYSPGVDEQNNKDEDGRRLDLLRAYDDRLVLPENPFGRDGFSHFHVACQLGKLRVVKAFLDRGLAVDLQSRITGERFFYGKALRAGETGLHVAVRTNNLKLTRLLLGRGADVNARDAFFETALHKALGGGTEAIVRTLLEHDALVEPRDCLGAHPLVLEFWREPSGGGLGMLNALLEYGADTTIIDAGALKSASCETSKPVFLRLVRHTKALIEAGIHVIDSATFDKMNECSVSKSDFDIAKFGNECRAELDGMTPFMRDVLRHDTRKLRKLVDNVAFKQEKKLEDKYPIYGYLLRACYRRGIRRRRLLQKAIPALRQIGYSPLSNEYAETVLDQLTDEELVFVLQAAGV